MFDANATGIFNAGTDTATIFEAVGRFIADKYHASIDQIPVPENIQTQYQKHTCADLTKQSITIDMQ
jgi:hypothetical protein